MLINVLLLAVLTAYYLRIVRLHGRENVLAPKSFYAGINLLRITPYMASVLADPDVVDVRVRQAIGAVNLNEVLTVYLACELLGAVVFFSLWRGRSADWTGRPSLRPAASFRPGLPTIGVLVCLGLALVGLRVQAAGGLGFLLANLALRAEITAGYGFLVTPAYACFALAVVAGAQRLASARTPSNWALFLGVMLVGAVGMSLFGGRKDSLLLGATALVAHAYFVRPLRWSSPVFPIAFLAVVVYTYFLGAARQLGGLDSVSADPASVLLDGLQNLSAFFKTVSYVDTYLFIVAHFQQAEYWWLSVFQSFPASFVPSLLYPDKPPVDEGVYIRTLLEGQFLTPPAPARVLYPSSLPPETLGNGYAAFGVPGVAAFFAVKAWFFRRAFRIRLRQWQALPLVFLVCFAYNFQVSPLRFVQLTQLLLICCACNVLIRLFRSARR
ncbi:Uncharacterised protein [Bordetella ansorpii]|uniref:Oligosaccharide repeat unit polymerase n=1 Tax=Bordetella ansorpii TaxID=288768 RepID=A0A146AVW9_9BORD|nr:hypothetical protein [Bordetella ansorpii]CZZ93968.1 Uncharacterised protein [Bordetella ansorpii]